MGRVHKFRGKGDKWRFGGVTPGNLFILVICWVLHLTR